MKQAIDILEHLSSDAAVRRRAADREARLRFDEMVRRDELQEVRATALAEGEARGLAEGEARGRAEGLAEGEARGRAEGEARARTVLLRLLESRFGALDDAQTRLVQAASPEQVDRWSAHAMVAPSLHDLLAR